MARPRFSIVIPTRNRPETLGPALATCLNQSFEDYEIVVCDNGDTPAASEVVAAAASPRVRYLAPIRPLAMSANWERALAEAQGEYVTVLGDDDGFMPYALRELDQLISSTGAKAIQWNRGIYTWPTIGIAGEASLLQLPLARTITEVDGRDQIGRVIRFEAGADSLPMIYCSVIHRGLIEKHKAATGRVFLNIYPDVYSAFGFGYLARRYVSVSVPMNIAGLSHASNGVATLMNEKRNAVASDFDQLNTAFGYVPHPLVPKKMALMPVHVVDCFLHAKDALFPQDDALGLDRKAITLRYLASITETDPERRAAVRMIIRDSLADSAELLRWFDQEAPSLPPAPPFTFRPARLGYDGNSLSLDASVLGVKDIAGAVQVATSLLGFDAGSIPYGLPSFHSLQTQAMLAQAAAQAATDRIDALQASQQGLEHELQDTRASLTRMELQLNEAHRTGSLRYVPKRLARKILHMMRKPRGAAS
jgi:glycosyltransferase involved in cell wall biosynthesis